MNPKKKRIFLIIAIMAVLMCRIFGNDVLITAHAESESVFSIEAELLPGDKETYDIRLTVENQGADWEGSARLMIDESYRRPSAYDTALALPQGSRKQFVVKVPITSIDRSDGTVKVTLLNRDDEEVAVKEFRRLLMGQMEALFMGILSDSYADLTYLDMGGEEVYFYNDFYPVRLKELQQGSLEDELDALTVLVIDKYNTGILTPDELDAIESWNLNGGVLILGTGAYAEDTLSGLEDSYLGISYQEVDALSYTSYYGGDDVDWSQLTTVELLNTATRYSRSYKDYYSRAFLGSMGNGSVCALPYSLVELGKADDFYLDTTREEFVKRFLEDASDYASSRYSSSSYYTDDNYYIKSMMGVMANSNSILNFSVLKVIVIAYVIFVGPVLYLVLRFLKRRELYWIAVPVTAVLGIVLVFLAGRGFEVVSTQVYSVSVKNMSDSEKNVAYMHCYDADRKEWDLRLADGCEYAGPLNNTSYSSIGESYYYHFKREGDSFFLGLNPDSNFEDGYFYLGRPASGDWVTGSILLQNLAIDEDDATGGSGLKGTVVNDTNQDMEYFAVIRNGSWYVFEGLPAGATCDLQNTIPLYNRSFYHHSSYVYDFLDSFYNDGDYGKVSVLSALGVGIYSVSQQLDANEFAVIGVVENWENIVNDNCNEISYGCLYSVQ